MILEERWELELNNVISADEWSETCLSGHKLTNSPKWREFDWKIKWACPNIATI